MPRITAMRRFDTVVRYFVLPAAAVCLGVLLAACGGSSGATMSQPVPVTSHVIATSVADSTKSATVSVTAVPGVSIMPASIRLLPGGTQMFITRLTGTTNTAVSFSAKAGSITAAGVYTAPQTPGTYSVVATSLAAGQWVNVADNLGAATATVTVAINYRPVLADREHARPTR